MNALRARLSGLHGFWAKRPPSPVRELPPHGATIEIEDKVTLSIIYLHGAADALKVSVYASRFFGTKRTFTIQEANHYIDWLAQQGFVEECPVHAQDGSSDDVRSHSTTYYKLTPAGRQEALPYQDIINTEIQQERT